MLTQLSAVILVQTKACAHRHRLVPLGEFTDFSAGEHNRLSGLEVGFYYESSVVDKSVFVDDIENFGVDVNYA